jgi:hypothetical protein
MLNNIKERIYRNMKYIFIPLLLTTVAAGLVVTSLHPLWIQEIVTFMGFVTILYGIILVAISLRVGKDHQASSRNKG